MKRVYEILIEGNGTYRLRQHKVYLAFKQWLRERGISYFCCEYSDYVWEVEYGYSE